MKIRAISVSTIAVLAGVTLSLAGAVAAEPQVPRLDVTPTCRPLDKGELQLDEKRCRESENEAREQLVRVWSSFPAADRAECTTAATMGGTASYVELITCLEMKRNVAELSNGSNNGISGTGPARTGRKR
ncbi:MAG TPA: hypothetical protein VK438_07415 [Xanthobacteraceae bacterium]|nr:hypothetical protein [Xanthobacteraceae bacterium]